MLAELERIAKDTPDHVLSTIFFGGGTPSLMPPKLVGKLIDRATSLWRQTNEVEISLEANPTSIEMENFRGFASAGVNRVSMGVQALNNRDLRKLGRMHSAEDAMKGLGIARQVFDRVSIDLIYARQEQSPANWKQELGQALSLGLDHMSLYQLTIEPGTVFGARHERGKLKGLPDEDISVEMWEMTQEMTAAAGMPAYEVSNHAKPGAESRHNLLYWTGGDWGAVGPGAHGRLTIDGTRFATETALAPEAWLSRVEEKGTGETVREALEAEEVVDEAVLMGLRVVDGLSLERMKGLGWSLPRREIDDLADEGLVEMTGERLAVTAKGRPLLNAIIEKLLV